MKSLFFEFWKKIPKSLLSLKNFSLFHLNFDQIQALNTHKQNSASAFAAKLQQIFIFG